ncbi:MAG: DNA gyrase modulator, partial [Cyanobacteria bacterium P01_F01_bin.3]
MTAATFEQPLRLEQIPSLTYSSTADKFDETWRAPLSTLLGLGRAVGADFVEFFLERKNYISCLAEDDAITSIDPSLVSGAGVRVFKGSSDCYVSTNDLSFDGLKSALEKGLAIMGLETPAANASVPEINLEPLRDYGVTRAKDNWLASCPSMQVMGDVLLEANAALAKKADHVQARRASYFRDWQEVLVASSDGTFARDVRLTQSVGFNLLCADGDHRSSIGERLGNTGDPSFLTAWDYNETADKVAEAAGKMLYADYVESGNYPVIMA